MIMSFYFFYREWWFLLAVRLYSLVADAEGSVIGHWGSLGDGRKSKFQLAANCGHAARKNMLIFPGAGTRPDR